MFERTHARTHACTRDAALERDRGEHGRHGDHDPVLLLVERHDEGAEGHRDELEGAEVCKGACADGAAM
jgi:hypothetical protein